MKPVAFALEFGKSVANLLYDLSAGVDCCRDIHLSPGRQAAGAT